MDDIIAIAAPLSTAAGLPKPVDAKRLSGGKNNRVFLLTDDAGQAHVLKLYHVSVGDQRDRLGAEWQLINYARQRGIGSVPEPLAMNRAMSAALYTFCEGEKLAPSEVTATHIDAALDFIVALNRIPRMIEDIAPGSEACFSIADHVETVTRRVQRLANLDREAPHGAEALDFVKARLNPVWARLEAHILAQAGDGAALPLPVEARIVSPSDFGFHNALVKGDAISFIDFEYAGMDDPAKLVGDFFSVPEIPTPVSGLDRFVDGLEQGLGLGASFGARARLLLDAYRIKWACIILNDFLPQGEARRAFSLDTARAERCRNQLDKAALKLSELSTL
jgi:dUTPase